jgi:hypothetical protein
MPTIDQSLVILKDGNGKPIKHIVVEGMSSQLKTHLSTKEDGDAESVIE